MQAVESTASKLEITTSAISVHGVLLAKNVCITVDWRIKFYNFLFPVMLGIISKCSTIRAVGIKISKSL